MSAQAAGARMGAIVVSVIVALAMTAGFHWIFVGTSNGHKLCVLPKDQLGFKDTFIGEESDLKLLLAHPILAAQIASGHGWCAEL